MAYAACADVLSFSGLNLLLRTVLTYLINGKQNQIDLFFFADIIHILKAMFFKGNKMIAGPCIIMVSRTGYVGKFFDGSIDWIESCYK